MARLEINDETFIIWSLFSSVSSRLVLRLAVDRPLESITRLYYGLES